MRNIVFWKYHGCGNDFIIIERNEEIDYHDFAYHICDRHFGIGADGLLVFLSNPLGMRIFNRDGSEATMCGNGIRCFVKYIKDIQKIIQEEYDIQTLAGNIHVQTIQQDLMEVDMGEPDFTMTQTGIAKEDPIINYPFYMHFHIYMITTMFLGTIHTVLFVHDVNDRKWEEVGEHMHKHAFFKQQTNVNFVEIVNEHAIKVRTYEKGVGMTLACGSGACAAVYCAVMFGFCKKQVEVYLPAGLLHMQIQDNHVLMKGPAQYIGKGQYQYKGGKHGH